MRVHSTDRIEVEAGVGPVEAAKLFNYFAYGLPVIATNTAHFSQTIETEALGKLIEPDPDSIERAVLELKEHADAYKRAVIGFRRRWNADVAAFFEQRLDHLFAEPAASAAGCRQPA